MPDPTPGFATPRIPFKGWAWRGASLEIHELAAYSPEELTRHLGQARARIDREQDFPVLFRIYAHDAWHSQDRPGEIVFPADALFQIHEVQGLPDDRMALCLEQAVEETLDPEARSAGFETWLSTVAQSLPKPDRELAQAWTAPFARWAPDAREGDAPRLGIVYESEDAVKFAMAFSNLDEAAVRAVLEAQQRYLELAGIAGVDEDAPLLREREAVRHLLPDEERVIEPGKEMAYLKQATGREEAAIQLILDGEFGYCASIGLVDSPEAEDDDLDPAEPEGDEEILRIPGSHWHAVVEDPAAYLPSHLEVRPGAGNLLACVPSPSPRWAVVITTALPQGGALETLRTDGEPAEDHSTLIAAFPAARDGAPHRLTLHRIHTRASGCQAVVAASTRSGAPLAYFDIDWLHPWNEPEEDAEAEVALAGFAYRLGPAPRQEPGAIAHLIPVDNGNRDDFEFQGTIESADVLSAWDQTFYRLDLTVLRDPEPFTIPVYAARHTLPHGYRPRAGDQVRGCLWLQGAMPGRRGKVVVISDGGMGD